MRQLWTVGIVLFCASVAGAGVAYEAVSVSIGGSGLNNHGIVAGSYNDDAYYWSEDAGRVRVGPTTYTQYGLDINDRGDLVGCTKNTYNYGAYIRYSAFTVNINTSLAGDVALTQYPAAVNAAGETTGKNFSRDVPSGSRYKAATAYQEPLGGVTWGAEGSTSYDLNDRGIAVGSYSSQALVRMVSGTSVLPNLLETNGSSVALGINNAWTGFGGGMIVGSSRPAGYNKRHPCYWIGWGECQLIGSLGGDGGDAWAVNEHGQVVGWARNASAQARGFIYTRNGGIEDLNDLVIGSTLITDAVDINELGWILAKSGNSTVLLRPVYMSNPSAGTFDNGLADWQKSGDGEATPYEWTSGDTCARLKAGSPVTIEQLISTPDAAYSVSFDYEFLSTDPTATLTAELDGQLLATLTAPDALAGDWTTHTVTISDPTLMGLDDVALAFTYNGPTGTEILLDNVTITQAIPEPATFCLLGMGLAGLLRRRKRKRDRFSL